MPLALTACGETVQSEAKYPTGYDRKATGDANIYEKPQSIFGEDGLNVFGNKKDEETAGASGIGVNSFLWRAALDTVSFMPLASADPFGGTILTDWYSPPGITNERYKINVFILDRQLRSDGVSVKAFKQTQQKSGTWIDTPMPADTANTLEDTILTRARQLRNAQLSQ
ncbi:MAG: DUF3576 domain-containing protein [Alphaproteobacteria bacterium]|nr:DUF3576 domain-containing protein [Alphaproteobacteria bacterium]